MARLSWDKPSARTYQNGIDRGVIYLPSGLAIPWNGLTAVDEKIERDVSPVYFDGLKVFAGVSVGDFSATIHAVTYPDEVEELEGAVTVRRGVLVRDQTPKSFAMSYRTMIANDLNGEILGHKIHFIWNVTLVPTDRTFASVSDSPEIVEFAWDLVALPEELPGMRPTAHMSIDTRKLDPWFQEELERVIYGNDIYAADFPNMADFFTFLTTWYRVRIVDNGDGTWTAIEAKPGYISINEETNAFQIVNAKAGYLDADTYVISDTDGTEQYLIDVEVGADGTWTATTENDEIIEINSDGVFQIHAIDVDLVGPDSYRISSQIS